MLIKLTQQSNAGQEEPLYFYAYPIKWWDRFSDVADINVFPWRAVTADFQKLLIPDNEMGKKLFSHLFMLEERFPSFFVKHFHYPMIILTKRNT